jgi:hypothetical protein
MEETVQTLQMLQTVGELLNAALRHVNEQVYDEWVEDVETAAS